MDELYIGKQLFSFTRRLHRYTEMQTAQLGLTRTQSLILKFLEQNSDKPIYQKNIESEFCIRRSSVTSVLQLMEKKELIMRCDDEHDGRLKKIVLTEHGREVNKKVKQEILKIEKMLYEKLGQEETKRFLDSVQKLNEAVSD